MLRKYPNELRADLQRFYGINLDDMGDTVSVSHVAALASCLPLGSLVLERINPKNRYTETDWLLLGILNSLRDKPVDPFLDKKERKHLAVDVDTLRAKLAMPRKAVTYGN